MTRIAAWIYCCDGPGCTVEYQVTTGDLIPPPDPDSNESAMPNGGEVRSRNDATIAIRRAGWSVGKDRHQLCPRCREAARQIGEERAIMETMARAS